MRALLREPLLYFLLAGIGLFFISDLLGGDLAHRIVVDDAERQRLAAQWQTQMGRLPTDSELAALVDQWIREEIYYREALAMGLDRDDVIVRRRLVQKLTFLTEDLASRGTGDETDVRDYFRDNAERYQEPARLTFEHRYFSSERHSDAESVARQALAAINAGDPAATAEGAPTVGDPFMLQSSFVERSQREIAELFGREFAAAIAGVPEGPWQGPIRSAYGWHLVRVAARRPPRQPDFDEVTDQVTMDYRQEQRRQANEAFYQSLRANYEVVRP